MFARHSLVAVTLFACAGSAACSSSDSTGQTTNGNGGTAGSGGSASNTGGTGGTSTGGSAGSGGTGGTGGTAQTGGGSGSGGGAGTGGAGGSAQPDAGAGGSGGASGNAGTGGSGGATGSGGASGASGSGGASGSNGADGGAGSGQPDAGPGAGLSLIAPWANGLILTGVRGVSTPAVTGQVKVHNGDASSISVTATSITGTNANAYQIMGAPQLPASVAAGADLTLTIQLTTTGNSLPAAVPENDGANMLNAKLSVTTSGGSASANLFGVLCNAAKQEATLGQVLTTLGYKVNVGRAQNDANPSSGTAATLPKVEAGTDEIAAPLFVKAGSAMPALNLLARFSPKGPMPFGWYPKGSPMMRNKVANAAMVTDAQTSDKGRMVLPPIVGEPTFDPGSATFGVWVYTDGASHMYESGSGTTNGDYAYSEDASNTPANAHRTKVYPLKNATGVTIADNYLVVVEEAGNGDYQDFVFVLSNVKPAN